VNVDTCVRSPRGSKSSARLCRDARGGYGSIRQELAAGISSKTSGPSDKLPPKRAKGEPRGQIIVESRGSLREQADDRPIGSHAVSDGAADRNRHLSCANHWGA
jgi:hypothetical protein